MTTPATTVTDALETRLSVRDFLPTAVPMDTIRQVLATASRAPSGGNVQPWRIDVVSGARLDALKAIMQRRLAEVAAGDRSESPEYDIYPKELVSPHRDYRFKIGEDMYARLGIPREDKAKRLQWFARNYQFFGAPVALFCSVDRRMGPPQWSDLGMFLQTFMLLAVEQGLATCAQEYWSVRHGAIRAFVGAPQEEMLFCGMSIGRADSAAPINALRSERMPLEQWATFV